MRGRRAINLIDNNPEEDFRYCNWHMEFCDIAAINLNPKKIIGIDISKQMIEIGNTER